MGSKPKASVATRYSRQKPLLKNKKTDSVNSVVAGGSVAGVAVRIYHIFDR